MIAASITKSISAGIPYAAKEVKKFKKNPVKIFKSECPDIMLAKRRIAKLNKRAVYEISSITIKIAFNAVGVPEGINDPKKPSPWA